MRQIANTVTDRLFLQRIEQQLDGPPVKEPEPTFRDGTIFGEANRLTGAAEGQQQMGPEMLRLELAKALARVAHLGQTRKGTGEPYVNHLDRVASRLPTVRLRTVAWLHDTLEDTKVTAETLLELFPRDVVWDVIALTRGFPGAGKDETYEEFIQRTIREGSDGALQVKLADLADNMTDSWVAPGSELRARYIRADARLRAEVKRRIEEYVRRNAA